MMTIARVRELRTIYEATKDAPETRIDLDAWEVINTLEAALKVVEAARELNREMVLDAVHVDREGSSCGVCPKREALQKALKPFDSSEAGK